MRPARPGISTPILVSGRAFHFIEYPGAEWYLLWRNVFEWLPWPLFALTRFTEDDYYRDYL
jgi:hypothetical protein